MVNYRCFSLTPKREVVVGEVGVWKSVAQIITWTQNMQVVKTETNTVEHFFLLKAFQA